LEGATLRRWGLGLLACSLLVSSGAHARPDRSGEIEIAGFIGGRPGSAIGRFLEPTDVAVYDGARGGHRDDLVYVTDGRAGQGRVQQLDGDGNVVRAIGGFERARGVAVDQATGRFYVLDAGAGTVTQFATGGRALRSWAVDPGDGRTDGATAIAVRPSPPRTVLVADQADGRVVELSPDGRFLRAWGWGVRDGARRFQQCTPASGCRSGAWHNRPRRAWPDHLAVDRKGVVYASTFRGDTFQTGSFAVRTHIVRFRSGGGKGGSARLLQPLTPSAPLTNGATLGMDVERASGRLFAINNPFGPTRLDEVRRPAAALGSSRPPAVDVLDTIPFLQNVSGLATADGGRIVYLASGVVHEKAGGSSFSGCADDDAKHDCHGLIVLAPNQPPRMAITAPVSRGRDTAPAALLSPGGSASYRFEATSDGARWRPLGRWRNIIDFDRRTVRAPVDGLAAGRPYRVRVELVKKERGETVALTSSDMLYVAAPARNAP
jgi:DNA-binding beta-propeller fold protein YncE